MKVAKELSKLAPIALAIMIAFFAIVQVEMGNNIANADSQQNTNIRITLEAGDYKIVKDGTGLDIIQMEGFSSMPSPGDPMLPHKVYNTLVPPDTIWSSLRLNIVSAETRLLTGTYDIKPTPPDIAWADGRWLEDWGEAKDITNGRNTRVYGSDTNFPQSYIKLLPYSQMRKWRFTRVDFTPFQYNPVSKKLTLIESIVIEVSCRQSPTEIDQSLMRDKVMDSVAPEVFSNYEAAKGWYEQEGDEPSQTTYDYVIITTNAIESNSAKLASFASHKQSRGHSVLVITENEFGSLTGQAPNHKAEKIRKWLIDNYASYGIRNVLLIGDPHPYESTEGDIPMKMCWPRHGAGDSYEDAPTDYFYADLTGNWDIDGDQYYGEGTDDYPVSGGVDFSPEVYIGRIPVYSADYTTLDNILQKLIDYDTESGSAGWRKNILLPMGFQAAGYDGAMLAEQMKDDYLNNSGFSSYRMYQQGNGACSLNSSYTSEQELRGGTGVRDYWAANDIGIVCWWGHGSATQTAVGYDGCWDGILFDYSYRSSLDDDHPSFTYQCSCTNGYPENSNNLQYSLLKQGGIATVSATRVSWFNSGVTYGYFDGSTTNSGIGYEYVSRLVTGNCAAQALYLTKQSISPESATRLMNWYDFNLYGEPKTSLHCFASYSNDAHTTPCDHFNEYPEENIVYMYGSGFAATHSYKVAYYDGADDNVATETETSDGSGNLSSQHTFATGTDTAGDWHVIVCDATLNPPADYANVPGWGYTLAGYSFTVQQSAIPEFPTALTAIVVLALCAGTYLWIRRKATPVPA